MKKHKGKILSGITVFIMLFSMVFSMPIKVMALSTLYHRTSWGDEVNSSTGDWTLIDGDTLDLSDITNLDANEKTISVNGGSVKIIGATNKTFKNLVINITNGASVIIENLNITNDDYHRKSPIIAGDNNDNNKLIISRNNTIRTDAFGCAGISVKESTKLLITNVNDNTDTLNVFGGENGAAIGGGNTWYTQGVGSSGNITINGSGNVTATGGKYGAGIGGGEAGNSGYITIDGSVNVRATGGEHGAGIGGGDNGNGGNITINSSGNVTASGGEYGVGIGGGMCGNGGTITIGGTGNVTATGGNFAAGIGGGQSGSGGAITIVNPNIVAFGKSSSAGAINGSIEISAGASTLSLPIISGKLPSPLSTTADTNIYINNIFYVLTKVLTFPAGANSFFTTVVEPGKHTISTDGNSLVTNTTPTQGIYDLNTPGANVINLVIKKFTNLNYRHKLSNLNW